MSIAAAARKDAKQYAGAEGIAGSVFLHLGCRSQGVGQCQILVSSGVTSSQRSPTSTFNKNTETKNAHYNG